MTRFTLSLHSLAETDHLGATLAEVLPAGMTVALQGTLGAGKTRLVEALAAALGVARDHVVSPTFVLCQQYRGHLGRQPRTLHHFDAYRLRDCDEFLQLGVEEYFESDGIVLIEWADRVSECLPRELLTLELTVTGDQSRLATFTATGRRAEGVVEVLSERYCE